MVGTSARHLSLLVLGLAACGGDDPAGVGGSGGGGGATTTTSASGTVPVPATGTPSSSSTTSASDTTTSGGGEGGGDGGAGGVPVGLTCTDAPLPGAGGCNGGDPEATPDDCETSANEGCTTRALCGVTRPPFPRAAGPGVAYAELDGGVGTVDGELAYTELLAAGRILGTSNDGRAVVEDGGITSDVVSILDADGSRAASWGASGFDRAAVTSDGRVILSASRALFAYVEGVELEGDGMLALAAWTSSGGVSWARRLGPSTDPSGSLELRAIVALGGDVVIVGKYERAFDLGGVSLPDVLPSSDFGFVARVEGATGEVLWAQPIGYPLGGTANAVAIADDGDILVGGATVADTPGTVAALLRLSPDGDLVWESRTGASDLGGSQAINGLAVTPVGLVVGVGFFTRVLRAGGVEVINPSLEPDAMILSFDAADGAITSVRTWGAHPLDEPLGETDDRAWAVSAFCDHVVVSGDIDGRSHAFVGGHAIENPTDTWTGVVLELPSEGTWPDEGGGGGDVCEEAQAYCEARVDRSLSCGTSDHISTCLWEEPCLGAMLREDVACDVRTCEAEAPCDVDCDDVGLDTVLSETGSTFETDCEEAIGDGCGDYLPVGTCARMAHRDSDAYLDAQLPCVSPARSCLSTWMCLEAVAAEWERNAVGCGPELPVDPSICVDDAALCDAVAARTVDCDAFGPSSTADHCVAGRASFDATYRDEVECLLESCFAEAACHVECRDRVLLAPPSALGEEFIEGCLLVGNCADLFTGECTRIAHAWPDERIAAVLPCFDGSLSCDDAAECLEDVGSNDWYP